MKKLISSFFNDMIITVKKIYTILSDFLCGDFKMIKVILPKWLELVRSS